MCIRIGVDGLGGSCVCGMREHRGNKVWGEMC